MALSVEGKMIVRMRNILRANSAIVAVYDDRIYDSHVSTIYNPTWPAISMTLLNSAPVPYLVPAVDASFQVDLWHQERPGVKQDIYTQWNIVRGLLHLPQAGYDAASGLTLMEMREQESGAMMFETDTNLWHLAKRINVRGV